MGKPKTLLEGLCGHALSHDFQSIEVNYESGHERVFVVNGDLRIQVASYASSSADGIELRTNLDAAARKPVRTVIEGQVYLLKAHVTESFAEDSFTVEIQPAPKLDPSQPASFTAKQGQYMAFIHYYTKVHRAAPAETDLQRHFQVSPPSVHDMLKALQRNGLIEKTPGVPRSIRLLVDPEKLPRLD